MLLPTKHSGVRSVQVLSFLVAAIFITSIARAADDDAAIPLGEGQLFLKAPKDWVRKQPKTRIVEHEFATPAVKGDEQDGRMTVMGAGGTVDANIDRWAAQFAAKAGEAPKPKVEKKTIAGFEVHMVDLAGTYKDSPAGPFAGGKAVDRENYRMLAAIIVAPKIGNYFIKYYGPEKTVAENKAAFEKMIEGLEKK